jgi:hypothetical protein
VYSAFSAVAFSSPSPDAKGEREARGYGNFALGERFFLIVPLYIFLLADVKKLNCSNKLFCQLNKQ